MSTINCSFPDVTLLITHYNRSSSLERLLFAFKEQQCKFGDIVVSDDGSLPEHLDAVKKLEKQYLFQLITTPENKGLGNNINKGQDAVKTLYTLYVQEDFVPTSAFATHFEDAINIMSTDSRWDMIRFYAYLPYPYLKPFNRGFSEMVYNRWGLKTMKLHYYSDHPHLRKSNFFAKFGRYSETLNSRKTEYAKCVSFIQKKGKGLFFDEFKSLFIQQNSSTEPSTWKEKPWRTSSNPIIILIRNIYRQVKYNYDVNFKKLPG
jgi:glycosyltransferase involved in cell wall biosynthesis